MVHTNILLFRKARNSTCPRSQSTQIGPRNQPSLQRQPPGEVQTQYLRTPGDTTIWKTMMLYKMWRICKCKDNGTDWFTVGELEIFSKENFRRTGGLKWIMPCFYCCLSCNMKMNKMKVKSLVILICLYFCTQNDDDFFLSLLVFLFSYKLSDMTFQAINLRQDSN